MNSPPNVKFLTLFSNTYESKICQLVMYKEHGRGWIVQAAPFPCQMLKGHALGYVMRFAMTASYVTGILVKDKYTLESDLRTQYAHLLHKP